MNTLTTALFSATIFLGSFLAFQVQPILGKELLPGFGGSPAVWSTSLFFFMTLLLAGYAYAAWLVQKPPRIQAGINGVLVAVILTLVIVRFFLWASPITPPLTGIAGSGTGPAFQILQLLFLTIGLPYMLLSTTSSVLQFWSGRLSSTKSPYRLYVLSNAGSLLGILTYPFMVEPFFSLSTQGFIWSGVYILYSILFVSAAIVLFRARKLPGNSISAEIPPTSSAQPIPFKKIFLWIAYSFLATLALVAATNHVTQGIAPFPFVWLLPLALYLIGFMIAFAGWYRRITWAPLLFLATLGVTVLGQYNLAVGAFAQIFSVFIFLFFCTVLCAGETYRTRPESSRLATFYLAIALGGSLGSGFVNFAAPVLFADFWEFPLSVLISQVIVLRMFSVWMRAHSPSRILRLYSQGVLATCFFMVIILFVSPMLSKKESTLEQTRNFYGILRLVKEAPAHNRPESLTLMNGNTVHGSQLQDREAQRIPTTYYTTDSGVGHAFARYRKEAAGRPLHIGGVGLGAGTIAAYCEDSDSFRFYEINPEVIRVARESFTYIQNCPGTVDIVLGDARLELLRDAQERGPQQFDIFVLDAFSDDAIPVHLLTLEAFRTYLLHTKPEGIIAVHISNRYLDLLPVIRGIAEEFALTHVTITTTSDADQDKTSSQWVLLSRDARRLDTEEISAVAMPEDVDGQILRWTDDYSSLLPLLKIK